MRLKNLVFHISTAPPYKHRFFSDFTGAYMEDLLYIVEIGITFANFKTKYQTRNSNSKLELTFRDSKSKFNFQL